MTENWMEFKGNEKCALSLTENSYIVIDSFIKELQEIAEKYKEQGKYTLFNIRNGELCIFHQDKYIPE